MTNLVCTTLKVLIISVHPPQMKTDRTYRRLECFIWGNLSTCLDMVHIILHFIMLSFYCNAANMYINAEICITFQVLLTWQYQYQYICIFHGFNISVILQLLHCGVLDWLFYWLFPGSLVMQHSGETSTPTQGSVLYGTVNGAVGKCYTVY